MRQPTKREINKFKKAAEMLAELGNEGFYLYLASDNLNLMTDPSHDDHLKPQHDKVVATVNIPRSGGGDW